jgi:hypothetical protein
MTVLENVVVGAYGGTASDKRRVDRRALTRVGFEQGSLNFSGKPVNKQLRLL